MKKTEPSEEERKKKKNPVKKTEPSEEERKKKKKSQLVKSCWVGPLCVFSYKNAIELWVMETENSPKVFSVP